ncbi:diguanylate cyclase (GGDEF) domain-containing protein [Desulfonatronum thiosulfatophilum]|uniref:diguanylate cyclase n=1 Tax=Desulfonatronum thiosulfatophilum TaxID=617002 RepID=A0A1G6A8K7_9BACT|nr:GGDEF domain-containing protein [Desulfonatronum thiosulfatophilum]SDB04754.1 diguanylate cyclase (GGDEF) domain-containing protein [Desulfonatronum thiosulfatophilum]
MQGNQSHSRTEVLAIGLGPREEEEMQGILGPEFSLERFVFPCSGNGRPEMDNKLMALVSWRGVNGQIARLTRYSFSDENFPPRVLVLDAPVAQCDLERVVDAGFSSVLRYPFEPEKVKALVDQLMESQGLYKDLYHMAREICLEREILSRQADLLQFFNKILTNASFSLDTIEILHQAHEDLRILLPVKSVDAIFWQSNQNQELESEIFIHEHSGKQIQDRMIQFLLEHAEKHADQKIIGYHVNFMSKVESMEVIEDVREDDVLVLPLRFGGKSYGCISIASEKISRLGRDRLQTILAAVNHLALALRNALLFQQMRTRADRDALTRLPNRHYFDERMIQEVKRHQRYRIPLSLMMMDLDFFKSINDNYGHQAGDMVLQDIGRLLRDILRSSDIPARFGGEEFVVLLPHTTQEQAGILAGRILESIAKRRFHFKGKFFKVTASIGVASMETGFFAKNEDLLGEADAALYRAKASGRNMVCLAGEEDAEESRRQYA